MLLKQITASGPVFPSKKERFAAVDLKKAPEARAEIYRHETKDTRALLLTFTIAVELWYCK